MSNSCPPDTPQPIRRILRQEANFGCAVCGCPLIEYHHIIPRRQTDQHNPSDMIALCPTCHYRADMREYSESYLRELKGSPYNLITVQTKRTHTGFFIQSPDLKVFVASNTYINTPRILVVDEFDIITTTKEGGVPQLDINFFDRFDRWVAIIQQNEWFVDRRLVWDVEYKPRHLTIKCKPRQISLDVQIKNNVVYLQGNLYFNGYRIEATKDSLYLGGRDVLTIKESTFKNNMIGIAIGTGKPLFHQLLR